MSLDKARDEARRKHQQVRDGIDPATARDERVAEPTLGEVIATWQAEYADKNLTMKPSWPNTKSGVKQLQAWLGEWLVTSITRRPPFFGERHRREAGEDMGTGRGKRRTARPRDISGEGVPSI
jgi:hypothetical protein